MLLSTCCDALPLGEIDGDLGFCSLCHDHADFYLERSAMKTESMDIKDFGPLRHRGRSEESIAIEAMLPNTAMVITATVIKCTHLTQGYSCTFTNMASVMSRKSKDRIWSIKHVPAGHAIACFPKE